MGKSVFVRGKHMSYRYAIPFVLCSFFLCAIALPARQALGRAPQKPESGDAATSARDKRGACILLTSAEIEAVQGEPVKETKASVQPNGEMIISECVFHTTNFAKSVSVALATPSSAKPSALTPRKFWQKQFHAPGLKKEELAPKDIVSGESGTERDEGSKARHIQGLGEEAYWVGTPITGALYVLQGDNFLRISVGGVREEAARIEKSKALAFAVVKRL